MTNTLNKMKGGSSCGKSHSMKKRNPQSKKSKDRKMYGGSCASNHVNKAISGGCWTCGGKSKKAMKKHGSAKRSMRGTNSGKSKTKKRTRTLKKKQMRGGGASNIHNGCGFVNTKDIYLHGCDVAAIKNPNLGPISSGLASLGM